jgi:Flp pilus assembly protein TadB
VDHVERLLAMAWSAEGEELLRHYLGYALAARTVEVRGVTVDGALAILDRTQLETCEQLARRIHRLDTADQALDNFAADLLARLDYAQRWQWGGAKAVLAFLGLLLLLGVLPVVGGGLLNSTPAVMFGALVGALIVFVFVMRHRKQRWRLHAEVLGPLVWRPGR